MSSNSRETSCPSGNSWKHLGGKACLYGLRLELRASMRRSGLPGIQDLTYLRRLVSCRPRADSLDAATYGCTKYDLAELRVAFGMALGSRVRLWTSL
jgi:hypothetical protein